MSLILCELIVRLFGYDPWMLIVAGELRATVTMFDKDVGWKNKPGAYQFRNGAITVTIDQNGARSTGTSDEKVARTVTLIGDSVMFGYGLSDQKTFGWKLQARYPHVRVLNFASPGYSTLQSFLLLQKLYQHDIPADSMIILAFGNYMAARDIADASWVELLSHTTPGANVELPYAELDSSGALVTHSPSPYWPGWPLRNYLGMVRVAEELMKRLESLPRIPQQYRVSMLLLKRILALVNEHNGKLLVLLPFPDSMGETYQELNDTKTFPIIECFHPHVNEREYMTINDDHPDERVNAYWVNCVAPWIENVQSDS